MSAIAQNPWLMVLAIFIINVCYVTFFNNENDIDFERLSLCCCSS